MSRLSSERVHEKRGTALLCDAPELPATRAMPRPWEASRRPIQAADGQILEQASYRPVFPVHNGSKRLSMRRNRPHIPLQNYRSAHISRSLGTSAALVVALDLTGVTIRRRSEIPHAKRTTPGDGAALVVPAVGVGPGRVMADTEAGRQVREDTPGGPYNLTTVQQHHRATRVVRTAPLIGSLRGLERGPRRSGLRGCPRSDDRPRSLLGVAHHAHDCGVAFDVATEVTCTPAPGTDSRASPAPPGDRPGLGQGFGHADGSGTPIVDVTSDPDLGRSDVAFRR